VTTVATASRPRPGQDPVLGAALAVVAAGTVPGALALQVASELVATGMVRLRATAAELRAVGKDLRSVLRLAAAAMEDGFLDELRRGLEDISTAVTLIEHVSGQIEQALPVLDATAPTLGMINATLDQLNATIGQLEALPGVRIARRIVARPGGRPALLPD
jgi:hypothetical protein